MPHRASGPASHFGQQTVGQRVSVRLLAGGRGPSGGPAMRDVVGVLEAVVQDASGAQPDQWTVRRRDGSTERITVDQIVVAKVIPASTAKLRRAKDISAVELEQVAARGWQPLERATVGAWVLRASGGFTGRANSVLPLGDPETELDEALNCIADWYGERTLPARFQLPMPYATGLDQALAARGWTAYNPTLVLVADLEQVRVLAGDRPDLPSVELEDEPTEDWLSVYNYRGQSLPPIARAVMVNAQCPLFASVREDPDRGGSTVAVARAAITDDWVGVTAMDVPAVARRRGLATHTMKGILDYARTRGVRYVYLQAAEENEAALAMYDKLGFSVHHSYHYRVAHPTADYASS